MRKREHGLSAESKRKRVELSESKDRRLRMFRAPSAVCLWLFLLTAALTSAQATGPWE